jgi:plasmid stabilization system protein ParE
VARLEFAARAEADVKRIHEFVASTDPSAASALIDLIFEALEILERHPMIGRLAEDGLRELVISHGKTGGKQDSQGSDEG